MATFSASITAANLTGDIAAARMSTNIRTAISDAGGVRDAEVATAAGVVYSKLNLALGIVNADVSATAGILQTKLSVTPLTEGYWDIPLDVKGANAPGAFIGWDVSLAVTTEVEPLDQITVTAGTDAVMNAEIYQQVIDFARLTGFTITYQALILTGAGTVTVRLKNLTDVTTLASISTTATTLDEVESTAMTVPATEVTVRHSGQVTIGSTRIKIANPILRVKAG